MHSKGKTVFLLGLIFLLGFVGGCVTASHNAKITYPHITPPKEKEKKLIAIAGFENKSTYAADRIWDTSSQLLATHLVEMSYFRVVEWERMKQLFDWDALSTCSLVKRPNERSEARKILLCEYFLTGAITYFDVSQNSRVSALSKSKIIETTIRIDLLLQDSQTGEYVSAGIGEATVKQEFKGGFWGGMAGTWHPKSADEALSAAIRKGLFKLIMNYDKKVRSGE